MRLILNGINGHYLRNLTENCASQTEEVIAAVAYATDADILFEWCWKHNIPLRFYGRLDECVAVSVPILRKFLSRKSARFVCSLVQRHHAKVIWWRGIGVYIGSANLTDAAWHNNVEAGCFFPEEEITDEIAGDLLSLFATLQQHETPLTEEVVQAMAVRAAAIYAASPDPKQFWADPSFTRWGGLVHTAPQGAMDRKRQIFLEEWYATLQHLRDIGSAVTLAENRPSWISASAPAGAQTDQFLHAHYYQRTFDGRKANYMAFFEQNKGRRDDALAEAMQWWSRLPAAPSSEDEMLNTTAPYLQSALSPDGLSGITAAKFQEICMGVHAIKDYSRRVANKAVALPEGTPYTIPEKVAALSTRIWNDRSSNGGRVRYLLRYVLHDGTHEQLPERLWQGVNDPKWKIDGLGISALGEIVGWALPEQFPPRNGRTSKALKSLGYDVMVHVE
jgi:hypothetical protein